jgi:dipeptidyl-peptidase-4
LFFVDARTGRAEPVFDPERIERAFAALPGVSASQARAIASRAAGGGFPLSDDAAHVLVTHANDLWVYHKGEDRAVRVTNTPNEAEELAALSPNARRVAFVKSNNLFVAPADPALGKDERALTTDGRPNVIYNGRLDWVYDEEIYGRGTGRAFWWSPDSTRIAFLRLDETPVRTFAVINHLPRGQETENTPYPLPGEPNPLARLGVVRVTGSDPSPVWMDTSAYAPADLLLVRVGWTPDAAQVVFQAQNREQTFLDLLFADPATGRARRVLRDTTRAWVEADAEPRFLRDGTFLWRSERTGFKHLYHYRSDGTLIRSLTSGDWEVRAMNAVDESNGFVYVTGTRDSPVANHVYRVALDGRSEPTPLTLARPGSHRADFSPTGAFYRDSWSSIAAPPQSCPVRRRKRRARAHLHACSRAGSCRLRARHAGKDAGQNPRRVRDERPAPEARRLRPGQKVPRVLPRLRRPERPAGGRPLGSLQPVGPLPHPAGLPRLAVRQPVGERPGRAGRLDLVQELRRAGTERHRGRSGVPQTANRGWTPPGSASTAGVLAAT